MTNPFLEISQKLDLILRRLDAIEKKTEPISATRIPFNDFCREYDISRPTVYAWRDRGLIELEKIGGRQYVKAESVSLMKNFTINEQN